jgi:hypothetical protein
VTGSTGLRGATGSEGATGVTGSAGLRGVTGSEGATGATGTGVTGADGLQGEVGTTGATGTTGAEGATGSSGSTGAEGATGATGAEGPTGTAGATGPAGTTGLSQYAYIYNLSSETVATEADIVFDSNGLMTPGINHAPGTTGIEVVEAGTYELTFSVSGSEPNQMAIFQNETLVAGTIYASGAGTQQNTGQAIFLASAGDVLTIRNHTSSSAVTLATPIGGTEESTNASVVIKKLG